MGNSAKIVIIEDEVDIVTVMEYNLTREGFIVLSANRGDEGINLVFRELPNLVILDLMLPGVDGLAVCQQLKANKSTRNIPIIMVSARSDDSDVVIGLGLGADDYIKKPFGFKELVARVKAALRREIPVEQKLPQTLIYDELEINPSTHEVKISGEVLKFTATEFRILYELAANPHRTYSRKQLLLRALGDRTVVVDRNIDVHIRSVRKKITSAAEMIETVRGVGYRFSPE